MKHQGSIWRRWASVLLLGALLLGSATGADAQDEDAETLAPWSNVAELLADWKTYQRTLAELPREERVAVGLAFFEPLDWGTLIDWCREGHPAASSEAERRALQSVVDSKLRWRGPSADTLAMIVGDSRVVSGCQEPVVKYISKNRGLYAGTPAGEMLARAFLALADAQVRSPGVGFQLERGAVCLWDGELLMARMMEHFRSGERRRMEQGVAMLGLSIDPRAADSLLTLTRRLADSGRHPRVLEMAVATAGRRLGPRAFDVAHHVFRTTDDPGVRRAALQGMAWSGDWRSHAILLRQYDDSLAGIADSTHAAGGEAAHRYWDLWLSTRLAEPSLIEALEEGSYGDALLALELIDRESRYGPPASRDSLYEALEAWAAGASAADADRVRQIIGRFRAYPDRRVQEPAGGGF
ncbi:MAG: hypothetical protein GF330_07105 [Candidatus Eisenbacteria bacterium]|nr:hypothetical protein [Candidatus Eisenbacteria bacterium]